MGAAGLRLPASLATMSDAPEPTAKKRRGFGRPAQEQIWNHFERTASTAGQLLPSTEELQEQMWDVSAFSHSEEVELANTDEVLDMFSSYFEADVADAESRGSRISKDNIDTNLDFNSKVLDANYVAGTAPSLLAQTQGDHVSSFDVMQFVHTG